MANVLILPLSGSIIFDSNTAGSATVSPLSSAPRISFDNLGGINITSYVPSTSASTRFSVDGSNGRLFSVTDALTGDIFSVNDISGLPLINVYSGATDTITMGTYGYDTLVVAGSAVGMGTATPNERLTVVGNISSTGKTTSSELGFSTGATLIPTTISRPGFWISQAPTGSTVGDIQAYNIWASSGGELTTVLGPGQLIIGGGSPSKIAFSGGAYYATDLTLTRASSATLSVQTTNDVLANIQCAGLSATGIIQTSSDGTLSIPSISIGSITGTGLFCQQAYRMNVCVAGTHMMQFRQGGGTQDTIIPSTGGFGWDNTNNFTGTTDLWLVRDTSNTLAQRNGGTYTALSASAQTLRVYGFWEDANNYARSSITCNSNTTGGTYVQLAAETAGTGEDNIDVVITPAGTGAFYLGPPADGTTVGGNARGQYAVDLSMYRYTPTAIASGSWSFNSGLYVFSTGEGAFCHGNSSRATGNYSTAIGIEVAATANYSLATGRRAVSTRLGQRAFSTGGFTETTGDCQVVDFPLRCKTTTNSPVEMALDGSTTYLTIPSGIVMSGTLNIQGVSSDGGIVAHYTGTFSIKNVGGTTTLNSAVITVAPGMDAGTSLSVTANNAGSYLSIQTTGLSATTMRWTGHIEAVETAFGT